jgi:hypothetical protein
MRPLSLALGVAALLSIAPPARAEVTKAECVKANANAQTLRIGGRLNEAREKLTLCMDSACPAMVRDDCSQRLDELERGQPTIVFEAKDASGSDVSGVRVTIDGQPLADKLAGTALRVDPGEHTFTFASEGQEPLTKSFVIHEGEKNRLERIQLHPLPIAGAPASIDHLTVSSAPGMGTQKILGLTAGSLGIAGVAVGSIFGILSTSAASRQTTDCASATNCSHHTEALSDHGTASTDGAISTAGFIAAGVLLAAGVTLFFTARAPGDSPSHGLLVVPTVGPHTAALSFQWGM